MEKIKLQYIVPYIPHKQLVLINKGLEVIELRGCFLNNDRLDFMYIGKDYKFNTLSADKCKLILKSIDSVFEEYTNEKGRAYDTLLHALVDNTESHCDVYDQWVEHFLENRDISSIHQAPYEIIEALCEQHIDIFDLIPNGFATTLEL